MLVVAVAELTHLALHMLLAVQGVVEMEELGQQALLRELQIQAVEVVALVGIVVVPPLAHQEAQE